MLKRIHITAACLTIIVSVCGGCASSEDREGVYVVSGRVSRLQGVGIREDGVPAFPKRQTTYRTYSDNIGITYRFSRPKDMPPGLSNAFDGESAVADAPSFTCSTGAGPRGIRKVRPNPAGVPYPFGSDRRTAELFEFPYPVISYDFGGPPDIEATIGCESSSLMLNEEACGPDDTSGYCIDRLTRLPYFSIAGSPNKFKYMLFHPETVFTLSQYVHVLKIRWWALTIGTDDRDGMLRPSEGLELTDPLALYREPNDQVVGAGGLTDGRIRMAIQANVDAIWSQCGIAFRDVGWLQYANAVTSGEDLDVLDIPRWVTLSESKAMFVNGTDNVNEFSKSLVAAGKYDSSAINIYLQSRKHLINPGFGPPILAPGRAVPAPETEFPVDLNKPLPGGSLAVVAAKLQDANHPNDENRLGISIGSIARTVAHEIGHILLNTSDHPAICDSSGVAGPDEYNLMHGVGCNRALSTVGCCDLAQGGLPPSQATTLRVDQCATARANLRKIAQQPNGTRFFYQVGGDYASQ
jgi:hypothetical protein